MKKIIKIDDLEVYQLSMKLGEDIWKIVIEMEYFHRDIVGKQLMKAIDSVAANISEGYGRYYYRENKLFLYYSRGSLSETQTWLQKAQSRGIISSENFIRFSEEIKNLAIKLNNYINSIGSGTINYVKDTESENGPETTE